MEDSERLKLAENIREFSRHIIEDLMKQKATPEMLDKCVKRMIKVFPMPRKTKRKAKS